MTKYTLFTIKTLLTFCLVFNSLLFSQQAVTKIDSLLNDAYRLISSHPEQALELFKKADELASDNVNIKKQIGYLYLDFQDNENALHYFRSVDELSPSDTIKLQIAYILNSLNRNSEALEYFKLLKDSRDLEIRNKANSAIIILELNKSLQKFPWWGEIYSSPYYDNRFQTIFNFLQLKEGYFITKNRLLSLIAVLQITSDTKSRVDGTGQVPIIFSDNAAILGSGIFISPFDGLNLIMQTGLGIDLIKVAGKFKIKNDHRAILSYGTGVYPEISVPYTPNLTFKPLLELYSSYGYYSRYKNSIGYGTIRGGFRFAEFRKAALDFYLRFNLAIDTKKEFYNNIIEWGGGVKITPDHKWGLNFLIEFNKGNYFYKPEDSSQKKTYDSFRIYLIFGKVI